jgi:DNA-binding winged helix-turn-helix (wHTH) protein/Tol biopolymer transport system component
MSRVISGVYRFDEFELSPVRRIFARNGMPVSISPKAFEVLNYLVAHPGRVVTKDELLKAVWPESFVEESNLSQHVFALRKALGDRAGCIVTVPGRGYQFTAQVQEAMEPEAVGVTGQRAHSGDYIVQHIRERTQVVLQESSPSAGRSSTRLRLWWPTWVVAIPAVVVLVVYAAVRLNRPSTLRISTYEQITRDGHAKFLGGTDGSRVYFTEEPLDSIAEVSASGGAVDTIPVSVKEPWAGAVSPDGSTLLVISESGGMGPADSLWSLRLVGGSLRRLASGAIDSAWSPDGLRVAYITAAGDIWVIRSDGTEEYKLASPGGYIRSLAWSPDGTKLRFSKDGVLWELSSDGSNFHQVLPRWSNSSSQTFGQWAPDGLYYFVSDGQIWALDQRPSLGRIPPAKPVQLTFGPTVWDRPVLSRDGKNIFVSGRTKRGQLVRFDAKSKQFQPFLAGISAEFVTFANDAKTVAYVTYPEGILWRANADGSKPLQLTSPPVYPKSLRWSPDGTGILFVDRTPKGTTGIYVIAADGGAPRQVLPNDTENESDPTWSPDGQKIVFSTCPTLGASSKSDLRILDLAARKAALIPGSEGLVSPRWSPDGKFISAMTPDSMSMKVLSIESGKWSSLDTGSVAFPEWSHDSRFIYYLKWKGDAALLRIRPEDAKPQILAKMTNQHFTGFYTSWMNLDSSDAPLLLRDIGSDEIYALTLEAK